jgi:thioredoxin reductase (NADPH)
MYDVAIIGGGPAGVTAAIYASRYRLKTVILCNEFGGQVTKTHRIENYPGFRSISGMELAKHFRDQIEHNKIELIEKLVQGVRKVDDHFLINNEIRARMVIIAMGMKHRKLEIPGEEEFIGKGVSYCATCDAAFFKDKTVGVVGGNDSAAVAADILAQYAKKVYIIYRKEKLRAEPAWIEVIEGESKIEIIYNTNVTQVKGDQMMDTVVLDSGEEMKLDGLFIEIGSVPSTALTEEIGVTTTDKGFIPVDASQKTNIDGVYAAGDISLGCNCMRQIVAACAEGAIAAQSIFITLKKRAISEY